MQSLASTDQQPISNIIVASEVAKLHQQPEAHQAVEQKKVTAAPSDDLVTLSPASLAESAANAKPSIAVTSEEKKALLNPKSRKSFSVYG